MPRRPAATSHSPPFLPTANATIKIIFADDHCLSRCRPSACLCRRCPRPCHRIVQLSAPVGVLSGRHETNNTVKLPQSQVPHSLTLRSCLALHRQKNTRSTQPINSQPTVVSSRRRNQPPQPTTAVHHRPAGKFDRLRFCVCIVGELLAVGSSCGRTCWQYCVVRSGPTTPFELNLSLVPTLIFEWTADHWRFSCYCVSAVSSSNHHHQHEQLCIHSSRSLRGDSRDIAHALGRPPRRVLCTMSAFRVNVQIDLSTTTNTAAAVFSLVCCLCIQRRHCGAVLPP
jgi:hypothetical protein